MTEGSLILALLLLQLKHFLGDFAFQTNWMIQTKGVYGHIGGLTHAGIHGALTLVIVVDLGLPLEWVIALVVGETVVHYNIDWAKQKLTEP